MLLPALVHVYQVVSNSYYSTLEPNAFQLQVLQGEARSRTCGVPGGVGEQLLDSHSEQLLHLQHSMGIQNGTKLYFPSLDVGKLGWNTSAKAHLSSAACNSCLSKSIIWGLSQLLVSRSQFFWTQIPVSHFSETQFLICVTPQVPSYQLYLLIK